MPYERSFVLITPEGNRQPLGTMPFPEDGVFDPLLGHHISIFDSYKMACPECGRVWLESASNHPRRNPSGWSFRTNHCADHLTQWAEHRFQGNGIGVTAGAILSFTGSSYDTPGDGLWKLFLNLLPPALRAREIRQYVITDLFLNPSKEIHLAPRTSHDDQPTESSDSPFAQLQSLGL